MWMIESLFAAALLAQVPPQWPIGTEREVDEGVYMQVAEVEQGWRIWRIETKDGVRCQAVKSARGQPHPAPLGVGSAYFGGTPYLVVVAARHDDGLSYRPRRSWDGGQTSPQQMAGFHYFWHARHHGGVRLKYRLIGERFWTEPGPLEFDATAVGERPIEVVVTSWEYPAIFVGHSEETGVLDLIGLVWAQEQLRSCETVTPPAPASG
jgi:hypothetical protein